MKNFKEINRTFTVKKKLNELQSYLTRLRGLMLTLIILCSFGVGNAWGTDYFSDNFSTATGTGGMSSRTGWGSFTNCYNHYGSAVRLGTSSKSGSITKTAMAAIGASPTTIVVRFAAKRWNTDNVGLSISVGGAGTANATSIALSSQTSTSSAFSFDEKDYYEIIITGATSSTTITFSSSTTKRVLLGDVTISSASDTEYQFKLVENAKDIEAGDYLIVYNNTNALNDHYGNIEANTYSTYTNISSYYTAATKTIASNSTTEALVYKVYSTTNGYAIRKAFSSEFLGNSSNSTGATLRWDRNFTTSQNEWTLGVNSIVSARNSSYAIRYNSGSPRFAIYAPDGQSAVQLFKRTLVPSCSDPTINTHPTGGASYALNAAATALSVSATKNGSGPDLTYQWYSNTTDNNTTGTIISGATSSSYTPPTTSVGTKYYYCIVSSGTCTATSNTASVTVTGPVITVSSSSVNLGIKKVGGTYTGTFTVSGSNLEGNITLTKNTADADYVYYSIDPISITPTAGTVSAVTVTITYSPTTNGVHNVTNLITLSSTNAADVNVSVSAAGVYEDTFIDVLQETTGYTEASPHTERSTYTTPTLADKDVATSGTCEQQHWHFMGWITQAKYDAGTAISDGDLQTPTSANNTTYYAVWAKGSGSTTDKVINITTDTLTSYASVNKKIGGITFKSTDSWGKMTWSTYTYLQCKKNSSLYNDDAFPGYIKSVTITRQPSGNYDSSISGTVTLCVGSSKQPSVTCETAVSAYGGVTFNYTALNNYTYLAFSTGSTAATLASISITYTVGSYTYSDYLTTCCTSYDITLSGEGTVSGGTFSASVPSACAGNEVTLSNSICSGYTVGAWTITKTSNGDDVTASVLEGNTLTMPAYGVTVALSTTAKVDHFIDDLHNTAGYTGTGATVTGCNQTVPNLNDKSAPSDESCEQLHYKFVGWVDEDHIDSDGTLLSGYSIVSGGTTSWNATGTNYYAIWAKEL